jgi:FkbH-like protein
MLSNNVKMVIWDLDDTYWSGTLAEGAITPIPANKEIVITLAERGIISSICSKNNHAAAEAALTEQGIWSYFVFPKIEFGPKGQNIASIIETAGLRPQNVLFIDDNVLNLEEARHVSPGLMVADPVDILPGLLDLPELAGKDDRALTRLRQYKNLEVKAVERATSGQGNEDFLRGCGIMVEIDYEIEQQLDRVIELANRTNQLNYTKLRLETPEAVAAFKQQLSTYGTTAGIIRVTDKYGDYGIVGFFVLHRIATKNKLLHFVFSCRTMNMGIEQYIYERLQRPLIDIVPPVSNPICTFDVVDWIAEGASAGPKLGAVTSSKRLLLLGGCELLQLASMCSSNRDEFVNTMRDGLMIRFDDPGFILGDRQKIRNDPAIEKLNYWTHDDAVHFDFALSSSEIVIVALFGALNNNYFSSQDGVLVRIAEAALKRWRQRDGQWFADHFRQRDLNLAEKLGLIRTSLDRIAADSPTNAKRFVLGVNTKKMPAAAQLASVGWPGALRQEDGLASWLKALHGVAPGSRLVAIRHIFNMFLKDYCEKSETFIFVDLDHLTSYNDVQDIDPATGRLQPDHLTRSGYISIGSFIAAQLAGADNKTDIIAAA